MGKVLKWVFNIFSVFGLFVLVSSVLEKSIDLLLGSVGSESFSYSSSPDGESGLVVYKSYFDFWGFTRCKNRMYVVSEKTSYIRGGSLIDRDMVFSGPCTNEAQNSSMFEWIGNKKLSIYIVNRSKFPLEQKYLLSNVNLSTGVGISYYVPGQRN